MAELKGFNETEQRTIADIAAGDSDASVTMINLNKYVAEAGYPDGALYNDYMAALDTLLAEVGGKIVRRMPVLGQPVGAQPLDEILAIWYPSHKAFLELTSAPGSANNMRLRNASIAFAAIYRCPGNSY